MAAPMLASFRVKSSQYLPKLCNPNASFLKEFRRCYLGKELRRFYKNVSIVHADGGGFEVLLDRRKLRTPLGNVFKVPSEALALGVATEWEAQDKVVKRNTMHITQLCNTAIENPTHKTRSTIMNGIMEFLSTDTICYRVNDPPDLAQLQKDEWDPILKWVQEKYEVDLIPTYGIALPTIPDQTSEIFRKRLNTYNDWSLWGFQEIVESLKSLILTMALVDRIITVERAVFLSRLEMEFQINRWGSVEWYHDIEMMALRARVAAGTLMVHTNAEETTLKQKQ